MLIDVLTQTLDSRAIGVLLCCCVGVFSFPFKGTSLRHWSTTDFRCRCFTSTIRAALLQQGCTIKYQSTTQSCSTS